jgi:hypothetical protein
VYVQPPYIGATNSYGLFFNGAFPQGSIAAASGSPLSFVTSGGAGFSFSGGTVSIPSEPPGSSSATGTAGTITWDSNYVYVCVATNTWKRSALSSW